MAKIVNIFTKTDVLRGNLSVIQNDKQFKIKRVYYVYNSNVQRGFHSHKKTNQILICLKGQCKVEIMKKKSKKVYTLNAKNKGLYIKSSDWHKYKLINKNSILLVLADQIYNKNDYINKV